MLRAVQKTSTVPALPPRHDPQRRIRAMVDEHVGFVARTLTRAGVPSSELDDEIQRTFIVVSRRLDDVENGAERSFLFQVAVNLASHARRKLARRREILEDQPPERIEALATPEHLTDRKQMRQLLDEILAGMDPALRAVFKLHEFDEMNLTEIGLFLAVPRGTVASRLRRAREHIRKHIGAIELAADLDSEGAHKMDKPELLRREHMSAFGHALLDSGAVVPKTRMTVRKTLAALGLAR
jgi:RNA polymerase sigma-70 factor (ECF subfamily)